jgi:hypothetical protein
MKHTSQLLVVFGLLLGSLGCGSGKSKYDQIADRVCACQEESCEDAVRDEYEDVMLEWVATSMSTSEEGRNAGKAYQRASQCLQDLDDRVRASR